MKIKLEEILYKVKKFLSKYVTIMIIPHTAERPINFKISLLTITLISLLLAITIFISLMIILRKSTINEELLSLREKDKLWVTKNRLLIEEINRLNEKMQILKSEIQKIYEYTGVAKDQVYDLWGKGGVSDEKSLYNNTNELITIPEEVLNLKQFIDDINITLNCVKRVRAFLKTKREVIEKLPTVWPCAAGGYVTSRYGWRIHPIIRNKRDFHSGIDIASWPSAPVCASADGVVSFAGWKTGFGLCVMINHAYGFSTFYAHLSRINVREGQKVRKRQIIGAVGKTGLATGYHLHYEVRIGNHDVDPWPYLVDLKEE